MGFIYEGQLFTSLSAIAGKITGMSYNGPKLFGVRCARSSKSYKIKGGKDDLANK